MRALIFILCSFTCSAGTWFVDFQATGLNNGTSWANAWTNLSAVIVNNIIAGDTLEVAEGTYSGITWNKRSGTPEAPITLQLATDPSKRGHVHIGGCNIWRSYIQFNGALDPQFVPPALVADMDQITNNIGIHITTLGTGINVGGTHGTNGVKLSWVDIHDCGQLTGSFPASGEPQEHGMIINDSQSGMEIDHCSFRNNIFGDTINSPRQMVDWGGLSIHDCIFFNAGDDVIQINGGFDFFRNKVSLRTWGFASGHADVFQTWGSKIRIHHNIVFNFAPISGSDYNSISYAQMSTPIVGDFLFYNNLVYDDDQGRLGAPGLKISIDAWFSPGKLNTNQIITNIFIANNLFHKPNAQNVGFTVYGRSDPYRGTNIMVTFTNCLFVNNAFIDGYRMTSGQLQGVVVGLPGPNASNPIVNINQQTFPMLRNIVAGLNVNYSMGGNPDNSTVMPVFTSYTFFNPPYDFRLTPSDVEARDQGVNLNPYLNIIPMLDIDLDNRFRPDNCNWDIGPFEFTP